MDDRAVGRALRLLRRKEGRRQSDVAAIAGLSQPTISAIETGQLDTLALRTVRAAFRSVDADIVLLVRWRGGIVERLLDEGHAGLVGDAMNRLSTSGWEVDPEVSYSVYGERGSIDIVAWHPASRILLIIEVKTELVSLEATLRKLDEKVRLAPRIVAERHDRMPVRVARLLVLPADRTTTRHIERHRGVLDRALPARGAAVRRWLRHPNPSDPFAGIWQIRATTSRRRTVQRDARH